MLKTVLETLDGVDDAVKSFYAEADGRFVLQIDGVDSHPDVANLKSAYERVKADHSGVKAKLTEAEKRAAPEGFDLEAWTAFKEGKPDAQAQQQMVQLRQSLEAERDAALAKYEGAVEEFRMQKVNGDLADAIAAAGVTNPTYAKGARALLAPQVKLDGEKAIIDTDMGPMGLADFVKRWAGSDGKDFVSPPKGDDARGNDRGQQGPKTQGDFGGDRAARQAAIAAKYPELANN